MDPRLYQIVYISAATEPFSPAQLHALSSRASDRNQSIGVTGMLLYAKDTFYQVLEGEETTIRNLHEEIRQDRRHEKLEVICAQRIIKRRFSNWSMARVEDLLEQI